MTILSQLTDADLWKTYYEYKQDKLLKWEDENLTSFLEKAEYIPIAEDILAGGTFPPPRRSEISKMSSTKKRVVYTYPKKENLVLKLLTYLVIREYDHLFAPNLYSFRANRCARDAMESLAEVPGIGQMWSYKADISDYFNSIPIDRMLPILEQALPDDPELFRFLAGLLTNPLVNDNGTLREERKGIMAGTPISTFLANLYLADLDAHFHATERIYSRYSDDIILFAPSQEELERDVEFIHSSSFHDSKVKAWNKFVTGYLKESQLKTYTPRTDYGMVVDKLTQKLYIFKDGALFTTLAVSTGLYNERQPYNETRSGEFLIISRTGDFKSDNLICAKALRFNGGDLLHEVPHVLNADGSKNYKNCEPKLGTRASHGCIRVQRLKNAESINMTWIWNNIKVGTKMVVWEDYQGRQIPVPKDDTPLYYNANGGSNYHSTANCNGVKEKYLPLTAFTYGELDTGDYADLTVCSYCYPPLRKGEIEQINQEHLVSSPGMVPQHLRQED